MTRPCDPVGAIAAEIPYLTDADIRAMFPIFAKHLLPDPVGAVEIAARLGVARGTVDQWRQRALSFPEPR